MHHLSLLKRTSMLLVATLVASSAAHAAPTEVLQKTLERTATSGLILTTQVKKNVYRQEPYQANYTVEVPYQDTETYYVDVPYEVEESYTDYEDYYTTEYVCHSYVEYERQCHSERRCNYSASTDILGSIIERPREGGPGTYPEPKPEPRPSPRPEPRPEPRPSPRPEPPRCHDEQVCDNVPVTKQRCGYEQVSHTRAVTKYRTVTRYRKEARTRDVTRYRTEERCCVTKYRDVFDHQWTIAVELVFPQGTELLAGEKEVFKVELNGSEANPEITVTPKETVFGYRVVDKRKSAGKMQIILEEIPRYKASELKEKTLQNFLAVANEKGLSFRFHDNALFPRIESAFLVVVTERGSEKTVGTSELKVITQREQSGSLNLAWDLTKSYDVTLKVHRSGSVIAEKTVDFELKQPLEMKLDTAALKSSSNLSTKLSGRGESAVLALKDNTIAYANVVTKYNIKLIRKNWIGMKSTLLDKAVSRTSLKAQQGLYNISLKELGVSRSDLKDYFKSGSKVLVELDVTRTIAAGEKIRISKETSIVIK